MDPPTVHELIELLLLRVEAAVKRLEYVRRMVWAGWATAETDVDVQYFDELEDLIIDVIKLLDEVKTYVRGNLHG